MVEHGQVNVRIPSNAKSITIRIARKLREEPQFLAKLTRWMNEEADNPQSAFLADRVARLEDRVFDLASRLDRAGAGAPSLSAATSPSAEKPDHRQVDMFGGVVAKPAMPASTKWTTGEGKGRRLTEEGRVELHRLVAEGRPDGEIADLLGVRPFTVASQRKALRTSD